MSAGMPELGSKISLISKADIRYEGRLFTVDPQECTIALANVRSYGTEDRETLCPVAPQSQVYEYILFRGNDIKDIRVLNNVQSMPNDPAIMQMSAPPSLGGGGMPPNQFGGQFSLPMVAQSQYPQYHPMAGFPVGMHSQMNKSSELSSSVDLGPQPQPITGPIGSGIGHHANQVKDQGSMLEMLGGGNNSRSGTPGLGHRKSPTVDQGVQCQGGPSGAGNQQRDSRRGSNTVQRQPQQQQQRQEPQQRNNRTNSNNRQRYPSGSGSSNAAQSSGPSGSSGHYQNQNHQGSQHHNQMQRDREHPSQHPNQHLNQPNQHLNQSNQHMNQMQNQHQGMRNNQHLQQGMGINQGGNYNRGGWRGGRARGRGRGGFVPRTNNKLKFDKDYDFEQANTEFEELRNQLAKAKIDGEDVVVVDGDVKPVGTGGEGDKKDDSGNETGAGEPEVEDDPYTGYDKAKSFFDNISCDAVERSKGRSQRTDWRKERKLNSETFGVASARRGAWRGRGNNWRQPPHHQPWRPMRGGGGPQHNQHNNSQNRDNRAQGPQPRVNQSNNQGAPRPRNNQQPAEIVAAAK